MLDVTMIEKCADPSLSPAIVQQLVAAAGSDDPLTITIKSGGRILLVPKPKTPEEALDLMKHYVGKASVRIGITQFPAGVGITDVGQLDVGLADACENLKLGTAMFAKIGRIITRWYGSPTSKDVLPQLVEDAIHAWRTGEFDGKDVFRAVDPGGAGFPGSQSQSPGPRGIASRDRDEPAEIGTEAAPNDAKELATAGIRIDLSRIGGQR